jgi:hypothetical protein
MAGITPATKVPVTASTKTVVLVAGGGHGPGVEPCAGAGPQPSGNDPVKVTAQTRGLPGTFRSPLKLASGPSLALTKLAASGLAARASATAWSWLIAIGGVVALGAPAEHPANIAASTTEARMRILPLPLAAYATS